VRCDTQNDLMEELSEYCYSYHNVPYEYIVCMPYQEETLQKYLWLKGKH